MDATFFDTLVLGATFLGVGTALKAKGSCLIIERTTLIGSEFVNSFNEKPGKNIDVSSAFGKSFKKELLLRKAMNDNGDIYSAAAMFLLIDRIKKEGLSVLFSTEVLEITKKNSEFEVTLFNCDKKVVIRTKKIIDTTSEGILHHLILKTDAKKYLSAVIHNEKNQPLPSFAYAVTNKITNKSFLRFSIDLSDDWQVARKKFNQFLEQNHHLLNGWKIALVSTTFTYDISPVKIALSEDHFWVPSCSYYNLLQAADEGGSLC